AHGLGGGVDGHRRERAYGVLPVLLRRLPLPAARPAHPICGFRSVAAGVADGRDTRRAASILERATRRLAGTGYAYRQAETAGSHLRGGLSSFAPFVCALIPGEAIR